MLVLRSSLLAKPAYGGATCLPLAPLRSLISPRQGLSTSIAAVKGGKPNGRLQAPAGPPPPRKQAGPQPEALAGAASDPAAAPAPRRSETRVLAHSSGTFKGFGAPPESVQLQQQKQAQEQQASADASAQPAASAAPASSEPEGPPPDLRIFLYGVDEASTLAAIGECGWAGRVAITTDVRAAGAVVTAKLDRTGKNHIKQAQGERTAANAELPFICVGRMMTAANLQTALLPHLDPSAAAVPAAAPVKVAAAAKAAAPKAPAAPKVPKAAPAPGSPETLKATPGKAEAAKLKASAKAAAKAAAGAKAKATEAAV